MIQTIPIINNKGGVGKTTTCVNVAGGMARRGKRVLLVDLDSQGSASLSLGVSRNNLSPSIASVLFGERTLPDVIRSTGIDGLDLVTGALDLADSDLKLKQQSSGARRLQNVLESVESQYDLIWVDCPPSTSILSVNALVAADAFIIPVTPSYLALEGVVSLGKVVRKVRQNMGKAAPVLGILLTMVDRSEEQVEEVIDQLRTHYGGKVFDTEVGMDPHVEAAPSYDSDVFGHAPDSQGAADYEALLDEIQDRVDRYGDVYGNLVNKTQRRQASST